MKVPTFEECLAAAYIEYARSWADEHSESQAQAA